VAHIPGVRARRRARQTMNVPVRCGLVPSPRLSVIDACLCCASTIPTGFRADPARVPGRVSLRMRPSGIVIGEVRAEECLDVLVALNAGLLGMATLNSGQTCAVVLPSPTS
jgi:Type II/IV secretion system protein